jgi:hypothetical protein
MSTDEVVISQAAGLRLRLFSARGQILGFSVRSLEIDQSNGFKLAVLTARNKGAKELGFSHRDKVAGVVREAFRYLLTCKNRVHDTTRG